MVFQVFLSFAMQNAIHSKTPCTVSDKHQLFTTIQVLFISQLSIQIKMVFKSNRISWTDLPALEEHHVTPKEWPLFNIPTALETYQMYLFISKRMPGLKSYDEMMIILLEEKVKLIFFSPNRSPLYFNFSIHQNIVRFNQLMVILYSFLAQWQDNYQLIFTKSVSCKKGLLCILIGFFSPNESYIFF